MRRQAEGVSQDKLEKAIDTTLHEFVQKGPTADEVKRQPPILRCASSAASNP